MDTLGHEQNVLISAVQDLSSARALSRVTEIVRQAARRIANADGATFVLREGECCHYVDEDAISPLWKGLKFPLDSCVSGWAMRHGDLVAIPDIDKDSRVPLAAYRPTFVKSLLMVPIRKAAPIGAIGVYWAARHVPSAAETEMLAALANATSVAMENIDLQHALQAKIDELERASHHKNQFLLMLSHELRTPMNSILGWSEILRDYVDHLPADVRDGFDSIHRNARTEMRLIADLLDSSQVLAGRLALETSRIDLHGLVNDAAQSVQAQVAAKSIRLRMHVTPGAKLVDGDTDRLLQVIGNLLSNAIKFTPEGGRIDLSLGEGSGGYVLAVTDDGDGISSEALPNVFERFHSQSESMTRSHGGLGLGLSIVKSLVEAHGGRVVARSEGPGKGARFEVHLPRARVVARTDPAYRPEPARLA